MSLFFFFNDTATTEIYTLSLHDALPISDQLAAGFQHALRKQAERQPGAPAVRLLGPAECPVFRLKNYYRYHFQLQSTGAALRSEEHTSELQSPCNLVCRLLLEKKNNHDK